MRQYYFNNAALLTGSDVVLRLAGMGLRIWLANALGGAGMGLYQLVLAVYGLFITLATAGISVAATRLLTEELSRDKAAARGMLVRLVGALAAILWLEPRFFWILLPGGVAMLAFTYGFRKKLKLLHKNIQEADGALRIFMQERLESLLIVRSFSKESQAADRASL